MALSALEKARVLFYLGYSVYEDDGPAMRSLNSMDSKPLAEVFVRPVIEKLEQIDKQIHETMPLAKAITDGSIELRATYTFKHLARLGRAQVGRLASFLKISIASDVFSTGAGADPSTFYAGDPSEDRVDHRGFPTKLT